MTTETSPADSCDRELPAPTAPAAPSARRPGRPRVDDATRFLAHCAPPNATGCILWTGARDTRGHPIFTVRNAADLPVPSNARRYLWQRLHGPLTHGQAVLTTCGVRACLAPAHLTRQANAAPAEFDPTDRHAAYRAVVDSPSNLSGFLEKDWPLSQMAVFYSLTTAQVRAIRYHYKTKL